MRIPVQFGLPSKMLYRLGGLNNRNIFCHKFGGQKSEIRMSAWLSSNDNSFAGGHLLGIYSPGLFSVLTWSEDVNKLSGISSFKDTNSNKSLFLLTSLNLNYFLIGHISKYSHIGIQSFSRLSCEFSSQQYLN